MEYDAALSKAWMELKNAAKDEKFSVRLLFDEYVVNLQKQEVICLSSDSLAKNYAAILILHYLAQKIKGLPSIQGEWISFKELDGGIPYYPAFKKRVIDPLLKKYGAEPERFLEISRKFKSEKVETGDGDASVVFEALEPLQKPLAGSDVIFSDCGFVARPRRSAATTPSSSLIASSRENNPPSRRLLLGEVLDGVPMLITFWRADAEFGAEASVLFDKSIKAIFCTEDVVVLSAFVAANIK